MIVEQRWNEIQFLSWDKFKGMTPSIVQLEITRITKIMRAGTLDLEDHNALVRTRFALNQFVSCLEQAQKDTFESTCGPFVAEALVNMPSPASIDDVDTAHTLTYIIDRLNDLHERLPLVY